MLRLFAYSHLPIDSRTAIYRKYACAALDVHSKFKNSSGALELLLKKRDVEIAILEISEGATIH